jgi:hypothetical protein
MPRIMKVVRDMPEALECYRVTGSTSCGRNQPNHNGFCITCRPSSSFSCRKEISGFLGLYRTLTFSTAPCFCKFWAVSSSPATKNEQTLVARTIDLVSVPKQTGVNEGFVSCSPLRRTCPL